MRHTPQQPDAQSFGAFLLLIACLAGPAIAEAPLEEKGVGEEEKQVIGATAEVIETLSGLKCLARIDTGATTCSIHAENLEVDKGEKSMLKNIGKKVSFDLLGEKGERKRVEAVIADTVRVKTSDGKERRYKVWMTLRHAGVERRVHVTLNDRKHMEYRLLIGRNFLFGKFVVDVAQKTTPLKVASTKKKEAKQDEGG